MIELKIKFAIELIFSAIVYSAILGAFFYVAALTLS